MKQNTCTRLMSLLLTIAMVLSLFSVSAFAADAPDYAHLEIGTASGYPGETVKIPVYLKGIKEGQKCRGFDTTIVVGENLTLEGAEWTDLVSGFDRKICNKNSKYLNAVDMMNSGFRITKDGKLCDLLVKIADNADAENVGTVSLTKVSISGETALDFLNSTDGTMATRDLNAVVTPTDEDGNPVPVVSIKEAASFTINVEADKTSVTAGEDVTITVKVEGGSFVGAAAKLGYDSSKFDIKTADSGTGWSIISNGYAYYNAGKGLNSTLGIFVFTAKAQTEEVTGSFTLWDTYCEEEWGSGASTEVATPCKNNGKVDVTITLKNDLDVTAENKNVTYDGNEHAFNAVTCTADGAAIAYGKREGTYDLTEVPSYINVGTYPLYYKVTAPGYAPKTGSYTLTIKPATIEYTAVGYDGTYDGAKHTISVTVTKPATGVTITYSDKEDGEYTTTAPTLTEVGSKTVWFKITAPNYTEVKDSQTITISNAEITFEISANESVTYNGESHVSAKVSSKIPADVNVTYTCNGQTYSDVPSFTNAGTYVVSYTVTRANYGEKTGSYTFIIDKADIDASSYSIAANSDVNYDGAAHASATATIPEGLTVTYTCNGQTYNDVPSFTEIGTYTVSYTVSAGSNYNDIAGSYTFNIKDGTIEASGTGYDGTYDGDPHSITVTVAKPEGTTTYYRTSKDAGQWNTENPTFTNAGTYTVYWKVEKAGYTTVSGSDTVNIDKATITGFSITAKQDANYDGTAQVSADVTIGKPADATITYTCNEQTYNEVPSFTEIGKYTVSYTVSAGSNYNDIAGSYTFTIKDGTIEASSTGYRGTYDGNPHSITVTVAKPEGTTTYYRTSEDESTDASNWSTENPTFTNAGTYTVYWKVEKAGYTTASGSNTINITKKNVTISVGNKTKTIGDKDPDFSCTMTGLVDVRDLGEITYTRTPGETTGEYEITANYTANPNYEVTINKGTLTISTPDYKIEIEEYVIGYSLVLVYTDSNATFTYNGAAMYDVTTAGYENDGKSYHHTYALVVKGSAVEANVAAGITPVVKTLNCSDLDVNGSNSVDLRDAVAVVAVYNANENYMTNYMSIVLEADVNHDKQVNIDDFSRIKAEYLK